MLKLSRLLRIGWKLSESLLLSVSPFLSSQPEGRGLDGLNVSTLPSFLLAPVFSCYFEHRQDYGRPKIR